LLDELRRGVGMIAREAGKRVNDRDVSTSRRLAGYRVSEGVSAFRMG
jgi:hypothetical protein